MEKGKNHKGTKNTKILIFFVFFVPLWFFPRPPIPAQFEDKSLFLSPIKQLKNSPAEEIVTGITVPHHLLARDLIAHAFNYASRGRYDQILVLSPDHFNLGDTNISTTTRDFSTVFGTLYSDSAIVKKLVELPFIREQSFFYREHGIQAELPFIKYYFPESKVIVLTLKTSTPKDQLDQVVNKLKEVLSPDTLIVQSTDFSHYLRPDKAQIRDEQTIQILKQGDPEKLFDLKQPANMDSIAAQYLQTRLQREFFNSKLNILANKNSQDYTKEKVESSTSYIVQAYLKNGSMAKSGTLIFVGDIMLSRSVGDFMERRQDYNYPFMKIKDFLNGADITFGNLEGPISDRGVEVGRIYSFRSNPKVVEGLKNAGFDILSIANNHIWDYGQDAFTDTIKYLKESGIEPVGGGIDFKEAHEGVLKEVDGTKIVFLGYTDLLPRSTAAGPDSTGVSYLDIDQIINDIQAAKKRAEILVVSFHWGQEYQTKHSLRQEQIARAAIDAGADLIIGHHPHVVQEVEQYKNGWIAYSLGNFVFDQSFSPNTMNGLALRVNIKDSKVQGIEKIDLSISKYYQPSIKDK